LNGRKAAPNLSHFQIKAVFSLYIFHQVQNLIEVSGFDEVRIKIETLSFVFPPPREFVWQYIYSTPLANEVEHLYDTGRAALEHEVVAGKQKLLKGDALIVEPRVVIATA
jgi:hypothetical protein